MVHRIGIVLALVLAGSMTAQVDRYELGRRVRLFERAFASAPAASRGAATVAQLKDAVSAFFTLRLGVAGKHLNDARRALSKEPSRFAESLYLHPSTRVLASKARQLECRVRSFYKVALEQPVAGRVVIQLLRPRVPGAAPDSAHAKPVARVVVPWEEDRQEVALPIPANVLQPGDGWVLRASWLPPKPAAGGAAEIVFAEYPIAVVTKPKERIDAIAEVLKTKRKSASLQATMQRNFRNVRALVRGKTLETDYPVGALLKQLEADAALGVDAPLRRGPGEHWLVLKTGRTTSRVRVQIPGEVPSGGKVPVVIAMHGAGGSENMFFDTYGDGLVTKLAAKRGWILCAPRLGFAGVPLPALIDALAELFPVDTARVFVVGHSMGAGQTIRETTATPQRFRAVAALGGGGRVSRRADLSKLPFFVAAGAEDFGRGGASALHRSLRAAGAKGPDYREYPNIEHLAIVQVALPDVFAFFDQHAAAKK